MVYSSGYTKVGAGAKSNIFEYSVCSYGPGHFIVPKMAEKKAPPFLTRQDGRTVAFCVESPALALKALRQH